jgi:hypothetical protein
VNWEQRRLLVVTNFVLSSLIFVTMMMEALSSYGTSVLTRATRRNIPEDGILHSPVFHLESGIGAIDPIVAGVSSGLFMKKSNKLQTQCASVFEKYTASFFNVQGQI